ncbi:MAG: DNA-3-methyladenine glycosylase I [Bacteroidota bacterium]
MKQRCEWCKDTFEAYMQYHDNEWGVPVHDERTHFEFLVLESAQAGLSWATILKKREGYRAAFALFEVEKVASFDEEKVNELLENTAIVRNRKKIEATISNAQEFIQIQSQFGTFDQYIWDFVDGRPIQNYWRKREDVPVTTDESDKLAKDLKKRGFKFLGSTTIYAHMQAIGMVNDHTVDCFRHQELAS